MIVAKLVSRGLSSAPSSFIMHTTAPLLVRTAINRSCRIGNPHHIVTSSRLAL